MAAPRGQDPYLEVFPKPTPACDTGGIAERSAETPGTLADFSRYCGVAVAPEQIEQRGAGPRTHAVRRTIDMGECVASQHCHP